MSNEKELNNFIDLLFETNNNSDPKMTRNEINAMRNTQPPEKPTFVLSQKEIKNKIKFKLKESIMSGFSQIILTGGVGDGKTHFLNCIQAHFSDSELFFSVNSKVEEASTVGNNFVRLVINKLFKRYYKEFCNILIKIGEDLSSEEIPKEEIINKFSSENRISKQISLLLYSYNKEEKLKYNALNILSANYHSTDLRKVKVNKLATSEYVELLLLIVKYSRPLIVILDEFEHAYTILTPAAKRNFLSSYKYCIDTFAKKTVPITIVTAVTEQSVGWFKQGVEKEDKALWQRMKDHVENIEKFSISDNEIFTNLFTELANRYKYSYNYEISIDGSSDMRKRMYDYWGDSTASTRGNREIISAMIKIMDKLRMNNEKLEAKQTNFDYVESKTNNSQNYEEYNTHIEDAKQKWNEAHYNAKPGLLKTGFEQLLEFYNSEIINIDRNSILFKDEEDIKYVYIATGKNLENKLANCNKDRINLKNENEKNQVLTYFIYTKTEDIKAYLKQNPDIIPVSLDSIELYNIISFPYSSGVKLRDFYMDKLDRIISKLGLKEGR